jgi:disulfide bond formation protein DsbB
VAQHKAVLAQDSCALSIADKIITWTGLDMTMPAVFEPQATCVDAAASLLGVPYEFWTLLLFVFLGLLALVTLFKPQPQSKYFY